MKTSIALALLVSLSAPALAQEPQETPLILKEVASWKHGKRIQDLSFHPRQPLVASTAFGDHATVKVCNFGTGEVRYLVEVGVPPGRGLQWGGSNGILALGVTEPDPTGFKGELRVYVPAAYRLLKRIRLAKGERVSALAASPMGVGVAFVRTSEKGDNTLEVVTTEPSLPPSTLTTELGSTQVISLAWTSGEVHVATHDELRSYVEHAGGLALSRSHISIMRADMVTGLVASPRALGVLLQSGDFALHSESTTTRLELKLGKTKTPLLALARESESLCVILRAKPNLLRAFSLKTGEVQTELKLKSPATALSARGDHVSVGDESGVVRVFELDEATSSRK